MANVLDELIPDLYDSLQAVSRELVGIIPAVTASMTADAVAQNQILCIPVTPASENFDITIGKEPEVDGDEFENIEVKIAKFRIAKPILWNGEEELGLGATHGGLLANQFTQRMRSLVNEMEADLFHEAIVGARGGNYGLPGVTPFAGGSMRDFAQLVKLMNDAGAPQADRQMVLNTTAAAELRDNSNLFKVNEAGESGLLRQGVIGRLYNFDIRESAGARQMGIDTGVYLPNAVFTRDAILLATRAPYLPEGGDEATDVFPVTDPLSGLTFQVASYPGYLNRRVEIRVAWGVKTVNPQNSFVLHG